VLSQYTIYNTPDPAYLAGRINVSAFANLRATPWPFANINVPLNGHVCDRGAGDHSRSAVFARQSGPNENSTPGYLCCAGCWLRMASSRPPST
jgi:hypothetical protein